MNYTNVKMMWWLFVNTNGAGVGLNIMNYDCLTSYVHCDRVLTSFMNARSRLRKYTVWCRRFALHNVRASSWALHWFSWLNLYSAALKRDLNHGSILDSTGCVLQRRFLISSWDFERRYWTFSTALKAQRNVSAHFDRSNVDSPMH